MQGAEEEQWEGEERRELPAEGEEEEEYGPYQPATLVQYDLPIQESEMATHYPGYVNTIQRQQDRVSADRPVMASAEDILHCILPPRDLGDDWVQFVTSKPASRYDVRDLTEQFEYHLRDAKARESGICSVRGAIFSMCFDEITRQVTVDCAERGLLLLRIRDELRMTANAYRTLYEASVGFGKKKTVEAEKGKPEMEERIEQLSREKQAMQEEVNRLQAKLRALDRWCQERKEADHKRNTTEISFLQGQNKRLKAQEQRTREFQEQERKAFQS